MLVYLLVGLVLVAVAFIVLQRRKPGTADKVAATLDSAYKQGVEKAKEAVDTVKDKVS